MERNHGSIIILTVLTMDLKKLKKNLKNRNNNRYIFKLIN